MRILLLEDDPRSAELVVEVLDEHTVVVERDGERGRELVLFEPFDLVFLDVQLPHLRGDQICRIARAAGIITPIIALSGYALPEQATAGLEAGFTEYVAKPVSPGRLRELVRKYATVS